MYWAAADALSLGSQLGLAQQLPPVDELQRRISGMFDQMARRCRDVGIPQEDFDDVLEVYFWCLELGFMGKYAVGATEGGVAPVASNVGGEVSRALPASDVISPHGEPNEAVATLVQRERPIVALSLAFFGLALLVFIGLKVALLVGTSGVNDRMAKMYGSAPPPGAAPATSPTAAPIPGKP